MDAQILIQNYMEIFDSVRDGLMFVGTNGVIGMANSALEKLTGFAKDELTGSTCAVLNCDVCELLRSESEEAWCMLFEVGAAKEKRCLLMRKDGSYASAVKNAFLLKDREGRTVGAFETFTDISEIDRREQKIRELSMRLEGAPGSHGMVGKSPAMKKIYQIIATAAQEDAPVIIYGESGAGKGLVAYAVHKAGRRRDSPFVHFNCSVLDESLLEDELFGHMKGAFIGADRHRKGRFEAAQGGDIFLDEIADLPFSAQTRLLRVLETKQIERRGGHPPVRVDVRAITATNRNILELISQGAFRKDLFFRLNGIPIYVPALRERREDIPSLVRTFIRELRENTGKEIKGVSPEVMGLFGRYEWPGNVRELKSALEYAFVISEAGTIEIPHLPRQMLGSVSQGGIRPGPEFPSREVVRQPNEKEALLEALRLSRGNKTRAAKILGVHRMTVWNRMKKYGIQLKKEVH